MTCQELDSLLHPYLDGEFDAEERLEVERHLGSCPTCSNKVEEQVRFKEAFRRKVLRAQAEVRVPDGLRARVQAGIRAEERTKQYRRGLAWAMAAGVVAAASGLAYAYWPEEQRLFLEDAARRHAKWLPVEIGDTTPEEVEAWFGGKLDHRVPVPRFPNAKVAGARLSNVKDRPAAYIRYETPAEGGAAIRRIGLFVFDDSARNLPAAPLPNVELATSHGYNVAIWREGEIVYEMVTDLDERDIRELLEAQRQPRPSRPRATPPTAPIQPAALQP